MIPHQILNMKSDQNIQVGDLVGFKNPSICVGRFGTVVAISGGIHNLVDPYDGHMTQRQGIMYEVNVPTYIHPFTKGNVISTLRERIYKIAGPSIIVDEAVEDTVGV